MPSKPKELSAGKQYGGWNRRYEHDSKECGCAMKFSVYFPPQVEGSDKKVPVVIFLSGLTCDDQNFITKSGAQRTAAELGLALDDSWDFGSAAGFYLNATQPKWKQYRMYDYITKELFATLSAFESLDLSKVSVMGHSMGGHGALVLGLRNPALFASISAFSPIANPSIVPWGEKAFSNYLGPDRTAWQQYDATELVKSYSGPPRHVLIDVGTADSFLENQLKPDNFAAAATGPVKAELRKQEGYDHSYFFISTFLPDHLHHHASALK